MSKKPVLINNLGINEEGFSIELILNYLFGKRNILAFDEEVIYNRGDVVLFIQEDGSKILQQPIVNNVTGEYDPKLWGKVTVSEQINTDIANKQMVYIGERPPKYPNNMLWFNPLEYSDSSRLDDLGNDTSLDGSRTEDAVIVFSSTEPKDYRTRMWIRPIEPPKVDFEFDIEGLELAFITGEKDITVGPSNPDEFILWGDTDGYEPIEVSGFHDEANIKFDGEGVSYGTEPSETANIWLDTSELSQQGGDL